MRNGFLSVTCVGALLAALLPGCAGDGGGSVARRDVDATPPPEEMASVGNVGARESAVDTSFRDDPVGSRLAAREARQEEVRRAAEAAEARRGAAIEKAAEDAAGAEPSPGEIVIPDDAPTYAVAGMVGQVNGNAVYAHTVFEPIHEQLSALGRDSSPDEFRSVARKLIRGRLDEIVQNSLVLGEAVRDLSSDEVRGLRLMVQAEREELIRRYGGGSPTVAEQAILEEKGVTLAQSLEAYRQRVVVQRYLRQKLLPRINVTKRDVRRFYEQHDADFNRPGSVVLRQIIVHDPKAAQQIQLQLEAGKAFEELASRPPNMYRPNEGGLREQPVETDTELQPEALNEAFHSLEAEGDYAGPFKLGENYWFISASKVNPPVSRSLEDVQAEIEESLRAQQYRKLSEDYRKRLYTDGSFSDVGQMTDMLVEIAVTRYSAAAAAEDPS